MSKTGKRTPKLTKEEKDTIKADASWSSPVGAGIYFYNIKLRLGPTPVTKKEKKLFRILFGD